MARARSASRRPSTGRRTWPRTSARSRTSTRCRRRSHHKSPYDDGRLLCRRRRICLVLRAAGTSPRTPRPRLSSPPRRSSYDPCLVVVVVPRRQDPLAPGTINKVRPRTGLHRGYPTKFPIPSIGPKIRLLEPARRPLYIPAIAYIPNPSEEPQTKKFDHVLFPVGGQYRDGVVELSRSATVGKPETRRKENRINNENNNSNKDNSDRGN